MSEAAWRPGFMDKPIPETVYHYTGSAGLMGILRTNAIWATDITYLNDAREFAYGRDAVLQHFIQASGLGWDTNKGPQFASLGRGLVGAAAEATLHVMQTETRSFVACFCEEPDVLSQWRGYGAASGFALGFDAAAMRRNLESATNFPLVPVLYDADAQQQRLARLQEFSVEITQQQLEEMPESAFHELLSKLGDDMRGLLMSICIQFKSQAFEAEREWRIGGVLLGSLWDNVEFRDGGLGPTPYVNLELGEERLPLKEVVIGPGVEPELRRGAVAGMLAKHGYAPNEVNVRLSEVPFRPT